MKITNISLATVMLLGFATTVSATLKNEKITLKPNMIIKYNKLPSSVNSLSEVLSEGMFYGRIRTNLFYWDWQEEENNAGAKDNRAMGVGGSIVYKTAPYEGISATVGLYTSQNPTWANEDAGDISKVKAGKDTFSRYDIRDSGDYGMSVLAQAYLQYDISKSSIIAGRQTFETVFTKSNDTKMIPNTFDGISTTIKEFDKTTLKLAHFRAQKLRDHTSSHDVIAFNGWNENDDSAVNKSLTTALVGSNNTLNIISLTNKSIKNLKTDLSYAVVPSVVSNLTLEAHYIMPLNDDWKIAPGFRYMNQFDNLHTNQNVANLAVNTNGYTNPTSLDTNLLALRVDLKNKAFLARIGYSKIADKADIIAPWRGFPTGGFTRAMAQYNWYANTKTYMARVGYDFSKADILEGFSVMARYAIQDFDDNKAGVQADSNVIHIDARQNLGKNLEAKVRIGLVKADVGDTSKKDISYNEYRAELNYFF
ncbi:OprD family outer membrane porin [Sulfurimonas sp.]